MNYIYLLCFRQCPKGPNVFSHSGLASQSDKQNGIVDVPQATSNTLIP
jgi:hypothetical protein